MRLTLVIGGTRSGKSAHAERLARASGLCVRYVATANAGDPAMAERIAAHRARRPGEWTTVQAGARLADAIAGAHEQCVLLDGLGVWIAGEMHRAGAFAGEASADRGREARGMAEAHGGDEANGGDGASGAGERPSLRAVCERVLAQVDELLDALATGTGAGGDGDGLAIVVAEQAGAGVLPMDAASRAWLDALGEATQRIAARAARVELVLAGRALSLPAGGARVGASGESAARAGGAPAYGEPADTLRAGGAPASEETAQLRSHGDTAVRAGDADHAVNVLAGGPPRWLREELRAALERDASRYPDEREASAALAELHGRDAGEALPTNGGAEALWLIPAALRPTLAACVHPGFTEAEAALRAHGVPVARVLRERERGFALDPRAVPREADVVIVGNPASPSGTLDPAATLLALRRRGRVLVVDEAFMDLVPGEPASLARERLEDVIVVRSLTKTLAIPGLRAGYALAAPALVRRLRDVRPPWSANALALAALAAAARRPDELAVRARRAQAEREDLQRRLAGLAGVRTWPSSANFCLLQVADGPAVLRALRERRIAVRAAASFPGLGAGDLRVTARTAPENERLVAALAQALEQAERERAAASGVTVGAR
ncbi:MAG TPA: bifunctional adenosylcobinamide kinase/adenosylcobinamide-phosphate guanylyltransferase [Solirubrobacteraceae bacterium]|nr:bifunctional adenosylcobinamide kinase/adenosylcobinamide-phosphate guanylyltransferase [Solirubrobacteraceae bacterium]